MRPFACLLSASLACLALALLFGAAPARAGTVQVGNGTPASCAEGDLINALASANPGDVVTFNCGTLPHTITLSSVADGFIPPVDVTMDGGSPAQITLSGGGAVRLFTINPNATITLTNLTLAQGYQNYAGGALYNQGTLVLDNVVLRDSAAQTPVWGAGAIYNLPGATLIIRNSTLRGNTSAGGGAIFNEPGGHVRVENSQFISNSVAGLYGGAIFNYGWLTMTGGLLRDNSASNGGAIANLAGGRATLDGVSLVANQASDSAGGILAQGTIVITSSLLHGNSAPNFGGGLHLSGTAYISDTVFSSNSAYNGGGLLVTADSWARMTGGRLSDNTATAGGGLYKNGGYVNIINTEVEGNQAVLWGGGLYHEDAGSPPGLYRLTTTRLKLGHNSADTGGGLYNFSGGVTFYSGHIYGNSGSGIFNFGSVYASETTLEGNTASSTGGGILNGGTLWLANTTLSGNSAGNAGGGLFNGSGDTATLQHVTLNGNQAAGGGALRNLGVLTLTNTIVANSPAGGDCLGAVTYSRYSLASDSTCGLTGIGDQNNTDPQLTALGDYGGPTPVHMLMADSPAINGIVGSTDVLSIDQRGQPRPASGGYDIGAVERQPDDSDLAPRVYLPELIR